MFKCYCCLEAVFCFGRGFLFCCIFAANFILVCFQCFENKYKQTQHQSKPPSRFTEVMINVEICNSFNSFIILNSSGDDRKRLFVHMYLFYPEKEKMYQPKFVTCYEIATEICKTSPEICNTLKIGSKSNLVTQYISFIFQ